LPNAQVSDTTEADSSKSVRYINKMIQILSFSFLPSCSYLWVDIL